MALLATAVALTITAATSKPAVSHDAAVARNLNVFNSLVKELEMNYVDSIRTDEGFKAAIDAFLSTVDPYTEYFDSESQEALVKMTTGEYGGIGSYIMERDGETYISGPMEGSPSAQAGLRAGDRIVRVDSVEVSGLGSDKVTRMLRGVPGTKVNVDLVRPYTNDSLISVAIERRKLQQPSVPYTRLFDNGTGYIRLTSFIDKSPEEVKSAIETMRDSGNLRNLVLDLRGNGGGLLESAIDIVGFFVPKGTEVLRTRGRDGAREKIYKTRHTPLLPDIPLAVLIDGASASASEITAGALQDLDRAVVIGSRSYGKGLVQSTMSLPYEGLLKVTTARYYIPSGRLIQALDYSRRNPDGSVARTPDSLTNIYRTAHGREVRDGGGITPDVKIEWDSPSRLLYNMIRDNWIFDYATRYAASHPSIAPAEEFEIDDEIFEDFAAGIDPGRFDYDKVCETAIGELSKLVESEGYMNPEVTRTIDSLKKLLTHDLQADIAMKRPQISDYLGEEIASRYYYDRGRAAQSLRSDKALKEAMKILSSPDRLKELGIHGKNSK